MLNPLASPALLRQVAWIAAIFNAVLLVVLVANVPHVQPPLDDPQLVALGQSLKERKDAAVATEFRRRDAAVRAHYLSRTNLQRTGGILLTMGVLVMVAAFRRAQTLERKAFSPRGQPKPDPWAMAIARGRGALAGAGVLATALGLLAWTGRDTTPKPPPEAAAPTEADFAKAWPAFRGRYGDGVVSGPMPAAWNGTENKGLRWTAPIPLPGASSPIVWDGQVFVTGGDGKRREIYAFAAADGKLLWTGAVPPAPKEIEPFTDTGFAAPTPVTDGRRVVAIFADGQLAGFDLSGRRRWLQSLGVPDSQYTYSASLALWNDLVIVQMDVGSDPGKSALLAFDIMTGKPRWKTPHDGTQCWSSPVATADGAIVVNGSPWVAEFDAATGALRWKAKLMENDLATSPVVLKDRVLVGNAHAVVALIRRGGTGDVTASHVAWKIDEQQPDQASPATDGVRVLTINDAGTLVCRGLDDGRQRWDKTIDQMVRATPVVAEGRFWMLDEQGGMHVIPSADTFSEELRPLVPVAEEMKEHFFATPAVVGGVMYVRSNQRLFAVGAKP